MRVKDKLQLKLSIEINCFFSCEDDCNSIKFSVTQDTYSLDARLKCQDSDIRAASMKALSTPVDRAQWNFYR